MFQSIVNLFQALYQANRLFFHLLGTLGIVLIGLVIYFDRVELLLAFNFLREEPFILIFRISTLLGEVFSFALAFFILLFIKLRYALMIPVIGVFTALSTFILKLIFSAPRPMLWIKNNGLVEDIRIMDGVPVYEGLTSFPSGHTFAAFSLFTFLALIIPWKKAGAFFCVTLAVLVGVSRVFLLHHFAHDVLFGMILGVMVATLVYVLQAVFLTRYKVLDNRIGFFRVGDQVKSE